MSKAKTLKINVAHSTNNSDIIIITITVLITVNFHSEITVKGKTTILDRLHEINFTG